jgi:hypothetical protein
VAGNTYWENLLNIVHLPFPFLYLEKSRRQEDNIKMD